MYVFFIESAILFDLLDNLVLGNNIYLIWANFICLSFSFDRLTWVIYAPGNQLSGGRTPFLASLGTKWTLCKDMSVFRHQPPSGFSQSSAPSQLKSLVASFLYTQIIWASSGLEICEHFSFPNKSLIFMGNWLTAGHAPFTTDSSVGVSVVRSRIRGLIPVLTTPNPNNFIVLRH